MSEYYLKCVIMVQEVKQKIMEKYNSLINDKITEFCSTNEIQCLNKSIKSLNNRINFYHLLIKHLEENKPLFFQKKRLIEYEQKHKEYDIKIEVLYTKLGEEVSILEELSTSI